MLIETLIVLSVALPGDVRFVQDEFGDPPPPPPAAIEGEPDASAPPFAEPAPAPRAEKRTAPRDVDDDDDGQPGFVEKYFPFSLDESLHPAIDDRLWVFWLVQFLPFCLVPQTWLTPLLIGGEPGDDWVVDSLIIYVTHLLPHVCLYAGVIPCAFIPIVGGLCVSGVYLLNGLACAANGLYLMPVAFANRLNDGFLDDADGPEAWLFERRDDALAAAPMAY